MLVLPAPVSLAADTSPLDGFRALVCFCTGSLTARQRQRRDHSKHAAEQRPTQMSFGQQEPKARLGVRAWVLLGLCQVGEHASARYTQR